MLRSLNINEIPLLSIDQKHEIPLETRHVQTFSPFGAIAKRREDIGGAKAGARPKPVWPRDVLGCLRDLSQGKENLNDSCFMSWILQSEIYIDIYIYTHVVLLQEEELRNTCSSGMMIILQDTHKIAGKNNTNKPYKHRNLLVFSGKKKNNMDSCRCSMMFPLYNQSVEPNSNGCPPIAIHQMGIAALVNIWKPWDLIHMCQLLCK